MPRAIIYNCKCHISSACRICLFDLLNFLIDIFLNLLLNYNIYHVTMRIFVTIISCHYCGTFSSRMLWNTWVREEAASSEYLSWFFHMPIIFFALVLILYKDKTDSCSHFRNQFFAILRSDGTKKAVGMLVCSYLFYKQCFYKKTTERNKNCKRSPHSWHYLMMVLFLQTTSDWKSSSVVFNKPILFVMYESALWLYTTLDCATEKKIEKNQIVLQ